MNGEEETYLFNWALKLRAPFRAGSCGHFRGAINFAWLGVAWDQATAAHGPIRRCCGSRRWWGQWRRARGSGT